MESPSRMKRGLFFLILTQRLAPLGLSYYNHLYYFPTNPELAMTLIASLALPLETYGAPKVDWILSFLLN